MEPKMIDQFTMSQAKRDFSIGYLRSDWVIQRAPMADGWNLILHGGTNRGPLVDSRDRQARVFKTVDSVVAALRQIGFKVEGLTSA
jgi:hypothetical protein